MSEFHAVERVLDGRCVGAGELAAGQAFDAVDYLNALPLDALSMDAG